MLFYSAGPYFFFIEPTNLSLTGATTYPKFLSAILRKAVWNFDLLSPYSGYSHLYISVKDLCHFHLVSLMSKAKETRCVTVRSAGRGIRRKICYILHR